MTDFANRFKDQVRSNFDVSKEQYVQFEEKHDFYGKLTDHLMDYIFEAASVPPGWEQQPLKILDVGCGIGNSTKRLQRRFKQAVLTGLDLSRNMLEAARVQCPEVEFVCGDAERLAEYFPREHFDLVIYPASLFLLPRQEQALGQAQMVLKGGGVVAASMILGVRDSDNTPILTLSGLPGIVHNDKLRNYLEGLFFGVANTLIQISLPEETLRDIYAIPALLAGLFPKYSPSERLVKLDELLEEVQTRRLNLLQEWMLIVAKR